MTIKSNLARELMKTLKNEVDPNLLDILTLDTEGFREGKHAFPTIDEIIAEKSMLEAATFRGDLSTGNLLRTLKTNNTIPILVMDSCYSPALTKDDRSSIINIADRMAKAVLMLNDDRYKGVELKMRAIKSREGDFAPISYDMVSRGGKDNARKI